MRQIHVLRAITLTNQKGQSATFGKGVHPVDESFCSGWFFEQLVKDGSVKILDKKKVEKPEGKESKDEEHGGKQSEQAVVPQKKSKNKSKK